MTTGVVGERLELSDDDDAVGCCCTGLEEEDGTGVGTAVVLKVGRIVGGEIVGAVVEGRVVGEGVSFLLFIFI